MAPDRAGRPPVPPHAPRTAAGRLDDALLRADATLGAGALPSSRDAGRDRRSVLRRAGDLFDLKAVGAITVGLVRVGRRSRWARRWVRPELGMPMRTLMRTHRRAGGWADLAGVVASSDWRAGGGHRRPTGSSTAPWRPRLPRSRRQARVAEMAAVARFRVAPWLGSYARSRFVLVAVSASLATTCSSSTRTSRRR